MWLHLINIYKETASNWIGTDIENKYYFIVKYTTLIFHILFTTLEKSMLFCTVFITLIKKKKKQYVQIKSNQNKSMWILKVNHRIKMKYAIKATH